MAKSLRRQKLRDINRRKVLSAEERARVILDERTEHLASRRTSLTAPASNETQVLICGAGQERYGIPIQAVSEVLPFQACMPIPDGPPALAGVFGRNGRLVSVIDLGAALGSTGTPSDGESRHLVLLRREQPQVALLVDRAHGVSTVTPLATSEAGSFRSEAVTGYAEAKAGLADQESVLSLLDVDRLLRPFLPNSPVSGV
jgi:purine-binding chemotaxis protein CheW